MVYSKKNVDKKKVLEQGDARSIINNIRIEMEKEENEYRRQFNWNTQENFSD